MLPSRDRAVLVRPGVTRARPRREDMSMSTINSDVTTTASAIAPDTRGPDLGALDWEVDHLLTVFQDFQALLIDVGVDLARCEDVVELAQINDEIVELEDIAKRLCDLTDELHCVEYEIAELKDKLADRVEELEDRAA
jgi:hypothetical protein